MRHRFPLLILFVVTLPLSGCCSDARRSSALSDDDDEIPPAVISDVHYTGDGPSGPNSRTGIIVSGSYFRSTGVTTQDCMTRVPDHPEPSQRVWEPCRKVISSSGIMYHVKAEHAAAWDRVEIKVRGNDGNWSAPHVVRKD